MGDSANTLEIVREEQLSPSKSSININAEPKSIIESTPQCCTKCMCKAEINDTEEEIDPQTKKMVLDREKSLQREFEHRMEVKTNDLKDKFDYILQNEQIRASHMLREAYRERQEKISALQTQLECKNLAGLMYVMCLERRKCKMQKLKIVEEYTNYIRALQQILVEGQELILNLSRGYKTAARVDHEWREKVQKIVKEFQAYIYHFSGGSPETNQYIFDLPALLKTEASIYDDPEEDPIERSIDEEEIADEDDGSEEPEEKTWWQLMEGDCPPFIMFGDMADFKPPQRRNVLNAVKAEKTAPKKWKEYVFNNMFLKADCFNASMIKDKYSNRTSSNAKWECQAIQTDFKTPMGSYQGRDTFTSMDIRGGNMGSILKVISSNVTNPRPKATLLAARDSMEIASTTKLKEKQSKHSDSVADKVTLNLGNKLASFLDNSDLSENVEEELIKKTSANGDLSLDEEECIEAVSLSRLRSICNDSLDMIPSHVPDKDRIINYEKVCPMEECRRMKMDSFTHSLPPYMKASPFTHYEQTFEDYETCSPDQLGILKERIEAKKMKEKSLDQFSEEDPLEEWEPDREGVACQTSDISLPTCTCRAPSPTPADSIDQFHMADLIPIKKTLDRIRKDCFYDKDIEFNRFKVIGQESSIRKIPKENFNETRVEEIKKILKQHPSLCDIFQANTMC